ncbi:MAG: Pseudouridine synthase [Hydrocarboniphaga sp.]|uniref:pseudouridine synthase n=1 Tax=Hydrocarboniphaga sp. TaxID=2033016 RepID=UPI0026126E66|nr:pseudouridine synthase [Hydrocarboniphaga sp.]MDB5969024.1 Pseudouridine synthase [Hydrocarboniphaga sp.]
MSERIQKLLATAGIASRRAIETMIADGRVTVNGRPAEAGQRIDHNDHVRIDTRLVALNRKPEPVRVLLYRKKTGELVTRDDPEGRRTVFRKLPELTTGRWIAIGRLDINTSGLLLMTNDGELARRLMHPSFEIQREYAVRVLGSVDAAALARLRAGVELDDGFARFETIKPGEHYQDGHGGDEGEADDASSANSWWTVTVKQGRNRVVRRLFESQNTQVSRLMRVSYGPITLGRGIKAGTAREATAEELQALLQAVDLAEKKPARAAVKKAPAARRKPMPDASERPQQTKPRRSPRAAAEAERKREFFDRGDGSSKAGKGDARPGAKGGPKREFKPGGAKPEARRDIRKDDASPPKREFKSAGKPGGDAKREPRRDDRPKPAGRGDKPASARADSRKSSADSARKRSSTSASAERAKPAPRRGESKPYVKPSDSRPKPRRK